MSRTGHHARAADVPRQGARVRADETAEPRGAVVVDGPDAFRTEVLEVPGTVVVDFWAPWCAPCRAIGPVIDELAAELAGRVKFVKVDTDDNEDLARAYGVESIPTLHVYVDGSLDRTMVGAHPKREIRSWVTGADRPVAAEG